MRKNIIVVALAIEELLYSMTIASLPLSDGKCVLAVALANFSILRPLQHGRVVIVISTHKRRAANVHASSDSRTLMLVE
jgi:3-hydroxyisobutyrate dehydrogenase-like beta-hydroxyacid dehydrogenase